MLTALPSSLSLALPPWLKRVCLRGQQLPDQSDEG